LNVKIEFSDQLRIYLFELMLEMVNISRVIIWVNIKDELHVKHHINSHSIAFCILLNKRQRIQMKFYSKANNSNDSIQITQSFAQKVKILRVKRKFDTYFKYTKNH